MNKVRLLRNLMGAVCLVFVCAWVAQAQAFETWVASTGNNANAAGPNFCNRANPCRDFATALSVTTAGGTIQAVDSADFGTGGTLAISKSVRIVGTGVNANLNVPIGTTAVTVTLPTINDQVTFEHIEIDGNFITGSGGGGTADGINFNGSGKLKIDHCIITGFLRAGINMNPNNAVGTAGHLFVLNSLLTGNEQFGIWVHSQNANPAVVYLETSTVVDNGPFGTGIGLQLEAPGQANVNSSSFTHNGLAGIQAIAAAGTAEINLESVYSARNGAGIASGSLGGVANVRMSNTDVFDNVNVGITAAGGASITSFGNNRIAGNTAGNGPPTATLPQQ